MNANDYSKQPIHVPANTPKIEVHVHVCDEITDLTPYWHAQWYGVWLDEHRALVAPRGAGFAYREVFLATADTIEHQPGQPRKIHILTDQWVARMQQVVFEFDEDAEEVLGVPYQDWLNLSEESFDKIEFMILGNTPASPKIEKQTDDALGVKANTVRLPNELDAKIAQVAKDNGLSKQFVMRMTFDYIFNDPIKVDELLITLKAKG